MNYEDSMKRIVSLCLVLLSIEISTIFSQDLDRFPLKLLVIIDQWNYENPKIGNEGILSSLSYLSHSDINFLKSFIHVKDENVLLIRSKSKEDVTDKIDILNKIDDFLKTKANRNEKISLIIYYSGHGTSIITNEGQKIRCLLTERSYYDEKLGTFRNYLSELEFYDFCLNIRNNYQNINIFLFLDACYQVRKKFKAGEIIGWKPFSENISRNKTWEDATDFVFAAGFGKVPEEKSLIKKLKSHVNDILLPKLSVKQLGRIFPDLIYYNKSIENYLLRTNEAYIEIEFLPDFILEIDALPAQTGYRGKIKAGKHKFLLKKYGIVNYEYIAEVNLYPEDNIFLRFKDFQPILAKVILKPNNPYDVDENAISIIIGDNEIYAKLNPNLKSFEINNIMPGEYGNIYYNDKIIWRNFRVSSGEILEIPFEYSTGLNLHIKLSLSEQMTSINCPDNHIKKLIEDISDNNAYYCITKRHIFKYILNEIRWSTPLIQYPLDIIQDKFYLYLIYKEYFKILDKLSAKVIQTIHLSLIPYQTPSFHDHKTFLISKDGIIQILHNFNHSASYILKKNKIKKIFTINDSITVVVKDVGFNDEIIVLNNFNHKTNSTIVSITGKVNTILLMRKKIGVITSDGIYTFDKKFNRISQRRLLPNLNIYIKPIEWDNSLYVLNEDECFNLNLNNGGTKSFFKIPRIISSNYIQFQNYVCYLSPFHHSSFITAIDLDEHQFDTFLLKYDYTGVIGLSQYLVLYSDKYIHLYPVIIE